MRQITLVLALFLACCSALADVTTNSLLREMVDFERLTRRPDPFYKTSQASSYDRKSVTPGNSDWFANADWGKFIREEKVGDRTEYVMADLKGPGAVVRIWSANPVATIRFYFDGETEPRIKTRTVDLLTGKYAMMGQPFGYWALRGTNLYFPIPYEKSLKVTLDNSDADNPNMYYHVGYRTYEAGTKVSTYRADDVSADAIAEVANRLRRSAGYSHAVKWHIPDGDRPSNGVELSASRYTIASGESWSKSVSGRGRAITTLVLKPDMPTVPYSVKRWTDPRHAHNILRGLHLEIAFDGKTTVRVPVSDFFGAPPFGTPFNSFAFSISSDGEMVCRFWMPYKESATITLINTNPVSVRGNLELEVAPYEWDGRSRYFHSQWTADRGSTRPMRDFTFLDVKGEGHYVGSTLYIGNTTPAWWGEGDEKVWVDGEAFPSTFGTGTEDYYGYAWSDPRPYDGIAYHTQPSAGLPKNFGHISNNRWHLLDPITFNESLKFDMEIWHWQDVHATFAATTYWYATAGTTGPVALDSDLLNVEELFPPAPIEGAIEGELMRVVQKTAGETQIQSGYIELSDGKQLWWINASPGDELTLEFEIEEDGSYAIVGSFCHAADYGIHDIYIDGKWAGEHDFYGTGVSWKKIGLGTFELKKGTVRMEVTVKGANPLAKQLYMFGLDYIILEKVG